MLNGYKVCLRSVNLSNHKDLVAPSIKLIGELNQVNIFKVFHCNGLLLCLTKEYNSKLVVWNPYLGQTMWIELRITYSQTDMFSIGYDNNNNNHKILRIVCELDGYVKYEIYDFKANSWRFFSGWCTIMFNKRGVLLKGNTYFLAGARDSFLLCYDFSSESFGHPLDLPFNCRSVKEDTVLSTVRDEKLAMLFESRDTHKSINIWVTTKIEPNEVSWNKFLAVRRDTIIDLYSFFDTRSFFVDEEKKVAVICDIKRFKPNNDGFYHKACIIGENEYIKEVNLGESNYSFSLVCSLMFQV